MIEIDTSKFDTITKKLSDIIDEYEEIQMNIFNQVKDACNHSWIDNNSVAFSDLIASQKKDSSTVLEDIKKNKKLFDYISKEYQKIGKKVVCNLQSKEKIMTAINVTILRINDIINEFSYVDRSYYYYQIGSINNQKDKMVQTKNYLENLKKDTEELFKKIQKIENEINANVAKLNYNPVPAFSFDYISR